MWRARITVAGAVVAAGLASGAPRSPAAADDRPLRLTLAADEVGWISLAASGPARGLVTVRELAPAVEPAPAPEPAAAPEPAPAPGATVARLALRDGAAERGRVVRWSCARRARRFAATMRGSDGRILTATATITTPSCADRLRMIVVPSRLRPGESASVRVSDTWRFGRVAATVCARQGADATHCKRVRMAPGVKVQRLRLRLDRPGRRTIALRSQFGQRLRAAVEVREDARLRVLVTGDSVIVGIAQALAGELGERGVVREDAHPGRGITTPGFFLDWPAHARRSARDAQPDVTVVLLGYADAGYPLPTPDGETASCCERAWVDAYALRVRAMMAAYLRDGRGLVYWVLLPAPRSPAKARVARAENAAVRIAGRDLDDGVRVIGRVADILSPDGRYASVIRLDGRPQVVREPDGVHFTAPGIGVVKDVVGDALRRDDLTPQRARAPR